MTLRSTGHSVHVYIVRRRNYNYVNCVCTRWVERVGIEKILNSSSLTLKVRICYFLAYGLELVDTSNEQVLYDSVSSEEGMGLS